MPVFLCRVAHLARCRSSTLYVMHNVHTMVLMDESSQIARWIAEAMKTARIRAGIAEIDIAVRVGRKDPITVRRWERGENWPQNIDYVLAAYADAADLGGTRAMCELALDLWREHDEASPTQPAEDAAAAAAAGTPPPRDEPRESPGAKPSGEEAA